MKNGRRWIDDSKPPSWVDKPVFRIFFTWSIIFHWKSKTCIRDNTDKAVCLIFWCAFWDLDRKYLILKGKDVWLKVNQSLLILNCNVFLSAVGPFDYLLWPLILDIFWLKTIIPHTIFHPFLVSCFIHLIARLTILFFFVFFQSFTLLNI